MLVQRLNLRDYRNFATCDLELGAHFTVLWGHNGAGKTNILEAIYLVSTLRSFRTSDTATLIRQGAEAASIELAGHDPALGITSKLGVRLVPRGRSIRKVASADGKVVRAAADFYGRVRAILFTPEDLGILRGSPTGRRQFLDRVLFARDRGHISDVQRYEKTLRSRNHVLKREELSRAQRQGLIASYEVGLAELGARIWNRRTALLEEMAEPFAATFRQIHGAAGSKPGAEGDVLQGSMRYSAKLGDDIPPPERQAALARALEERRSEDERRGMTTLGPHRDDLLVDLDGHPASEFASQGQSRALVLAFKLAELRVAREATGTAPLLLLDDVSSELDPSRSQLLYETLARDAGQCLLTTTAPHFVQLPQDVETRRWHVERGIVRPDESAP